MNPIIDSWQVSAKDEFEAQITEEGRKSTRIDNRISTIKEILEKEPTIAKDSGSFSKLFYQIFDQSYPNLKEVKKILKSLSFYLDTIIEAEMRFTLANMAAMHDPNILDQLDTYKLEYKEFKNILQVIAKFQPDRFLAHLERFSGDEDQDFIDDLVEIAVSKIGFKTFSNGDSLTAFAQEKIVRVARKLSLSSDISGEIFYFFPIFGISDQKVTMEILKNCIPYLKDKRYFIDSFLSFQLSDENKGELIALVLEEEWLPPVLAKKAASFLIVACRMLDIEPFDMIFNCIVEFGHSGISGDEEHTKYLFDSLLNIAEMRRESFTLATTAFFQLYRQIPVSMSPEEMKMLQHFFLSIKKYGNKKFKDNVVFTPLLYQVNDVIGSFLLRSEKLELLNWALEQGDLYENMRNLQAFVATADLKFIENEILGNIRKNKKIDFKSHIGPQLFKIMNIKESYLKRYEETFNQDRNPTALLVYAAKLNHSKEMETLETLKEFIELVFTDQFTDSRYDLTKSEHLYVVFGGRPEQLKQWRRGIPARTLEQCSKALVDQETISRWLKEKLKDCRVSIDEMPYLKEFFHGEKSGEVLLEIIAKEAKSAKKGKIELSFAFKMQRIAIELMSSKTLKVRIQQFKALMELSGAKEQMGEFYNHLEEVCETFQEKNVLRGLTISMTDHRVDLFLAGVEVLGSCQAVDLQPDHIKCVMGTLMNGKTQIICIKDERGKIVARRFVRVLEDPIEKSLVMILEPLYNNRHADEDVLDAAIIHLAKEKGKEMGIKCVISNLYDGHVPYPNNLKLYKERAPYEYLDSLKEDHVVSGKKEHVISELAELDG